MVELQRAEAKYFAWLPAGYSNLNVRSPFAEHVNGILASIIRVLPRKKRKKKQKRKVVQLDIYRFFYANSTNQGYLFNGEHIISNRANLLEDVRGRG